MSYTNNPNTKILTPEQAKILYYYDENSVPSENPDISKILPKGDLLVIKESQDSIQLFIGDGKNAILDLQPISGVDANGNFISGENNSISETSKNNIIGGKDNKIQGNSNANIVIGNNLLINNNSSSAIFGKFNNNNANNILEIGNGTSEENRKNIISIGKINGNIEATTILCGNGVELRQHDENDTRTRINFLPKDQSHQGGYISNLLTPTTPPEADYSFYAANKKYVDDTITNKALLLKGGIMNGYIDMNSNSIFNINDISINGKIVSNQINMDSHKIINLATPTLNADAATKKYVDDLNIDRNTTPQTNQVLTWDGNKYTPKPGGGSGATTLSDLNDVSISSPAHGQFLTYDSSLSKWINTKSGVMPGDIEAAVEAYFSNPDHTIYRGGDGININGRTISLQIAPNSCFYINTAQDSKGLDLNIGQGLRLTSQTEPKITKLALNLGEGLTFDDFDTNVACLAPADQMYLGGVYIGSNYVRTGGTEYLDLATTNKPGFMSKADKEKLDNQLSDEIQMKVTFSDNTISIYKLQGEQIP